MRIQANQIRSVSKAEIEFEGLCVVTGKHQSGKTSLLTTLGGVLMGDAGVYGVTKTKCDALRSYGARRASMRIEADDWSQSIIWPDMEADFSGSAPESNLITIGRVHPAELSPKEWSRFVNSIADVPKVDGKVMRAKMAELGISEDDTAHLFEKLRSGDNGWQDANDAAAKKARSARTWWETITRENFGSKKAETWIADGYVDIDDEDILVAKVSNLTAELQHANAVSEVVGGSLSDLDAEIKVHKARMIGLKAELSSTQDQMAGANTKFAKYPTSHPMQCPGCGTLLQISPEKSLEKADGTLSLQSAEYQELRKLIGDLAEDEARIKAEGGKTRAKLEAAESTRNKMTVTSKSGRAPGTIKADLETHQKVLSAYQNTVEAEKQFKTWKIWTEAAEWLGPAGIRLERTKEALSNVQPRIDEFAQRLFPGYRLELQADDKGVHLMFSGKSQPGATGNDMEWMSYKQLVWNGDPNSYALRIQIMFQIIERQRLDAAGTPGAPILIDRFDTLLKADRNNVLVLLHELGMPAILGQAAQAKPKDDFLATNGVGKTFWIENGVVEAV